MLKTIFVLTISNIFLTVMGAHAQITNGMFSNGYNGWTLIGLNPATATPDTSSPPLGSVADALISSTSSAYEGAAANAANSATAAELEAAFGNITLPGSPGSSTVVDGQAIYQAFTLTAPAVLTFEFQSSSQDLSSYDKVGYILQNISAPMNSDFHSLPNSSSPYTPITPVTLAAGTYKLGFIAYNTGDNFSSTQIQVGDVLVETVPEPSVWFLLAGGSVLIALASRVATKRIPSRA